MKTHLYDQKQEWKPRWGYKRANDETKQWLLEVPEGADPYEDQFEKKKKEKSERVAKNELQRLRNLARAQKGKVPGVGLTPTGAPSKDHVLKALATTRKSDASLGKFSDPLPKEKPNKFAGKKRKFESNFVNTDEEKKRQMDVLKRMSSGQAVLDVQKATNTAIHEEEETRSKKAKGEGGAQKKKGGGSKGKGKGKAKKTFGKGKKGGKKGRKK
nr:hypothetical protein BaRGS_006735 [Batillaria attramentaria]